MMKPASSIVSTRLNVLVTQIAQNVTHGRWSVSTAKAPTSLAALKAQYAERQTFAVSAEASDRTIFGDDEVNYAFRAWHDATHLRLDAEFDFTGEHLVLLAQELDVRRLYGVNLWTDWVCAILEAEIVGQFLYERDHGHYPIDQRAFDLAYIARLGYTQEPV